MCRAHSRSRQKLLNMCSNCLRLYLYRLISVHGGGWGVSFLASAGYKESSHDISSGESIYIYSQAKCKYYFTKMVTEKPPPFTVAFLDWVIKLNSTNDIEAYIDFF